MPAAFLTLLAAASAAPIDEGDWGADCTGPPVGSDRFLLPGEPGNELLLVYVDEATHPEARCNDGTPASYYVRPGTGPDRDRWILHVQGAGACDTFERCLMRWCGTGGNYSGDFMSSAESTPSILGGGIFQPDPVLNRFAGFTHVFLRYCSSDFWVGDADDVELVSEQDPDRSFSVSYAGRAIVAAQVAELRAHGPELVDLGLPDLDDATQVLVTGSTSGAHGAILNGDAIAAELPGVDVRLVLDSTLYPSADLLAGAPYSGEVLPQDVEAFQAWAESWPLWGATPEPGCGAAHPGPESWRCADRMHVLTSHLRTPFFVHSDQVDPEAPMCGEAHAGTYAPPCPADIVAQLESLADIQTPSPGREGPVLQSGPLPGYHGPRCGFDSHAAMATWQDDLGFFHLKIPQPDGSWLSFHDVLWSWVDSDGGPTTVLQPLDAAEDCPTPPPSVVTKVVATLDEALDRVVVTWQATPFADTYVVQSALGALPPTTIPEAVLEGPLPAGELCFTVDAINAVGASGPSGSACLIVPGETATEPDTGAGPAPAISASGASCACDTGGTSGWWMVGPLALALTAARTGRRGSSRRRPTGGAPSPRCRRHPPR